MAQIVTKEYFKGIRKRLKEEGKTVVLCHGVFDLVHPGHIIHFENAKQMGDILAVSITAARYVRKGPGRPYFNDEMRLKFLSAISCIDYVMLSEGYTVDDIIEACDTRKRVIAAFEMLFTKKEDCPDRKHGTV